MAAALREIVIVQGHPDPAGGHFCHALADAYVHGARDIGHIVRAIDLAQLEMAFLRSRADQLGLPPSGIAHLQDSLVHADHLVLFFPIWNGSAPARVRACLEQTIRPAFIFCDFSPDQKLGFAAAFKRKVLAGKTARIVATMQMPAWLYRWYYHPHLERNTLRLAGFSPVRETLIGGVESADRERREGWLREARRLGQDAK